MKKPRHLGVVALIALLILSYAPLRFGGLRTYELALADTSGPNFAGSESSAGVTGCTDNMNWTVNAGALGANDTTYVTYTGTAWDSGNTSDEVRASNFGFTGLTGTLDGIVVEVLGWTIAGGGTYTRVQLFSTPGSNVGDNKAAGSLPTSDPGSTYQSFGASNDTWNSGLTLSDVMSSNFGVAMCWTATTNNSTADIDAVRITITYTPPSFTVPVVVTGYADNIGATSALLHGTITNDGGGITDYGFATSTNPRFQSGVSTTSLGTGSAGPFSYTSKGHAANTVYYVRAYAGNSAGTAIATGTRFMTGDNSVVRRLRLFSGFIIRLIRGKISLRQSGPAVIFLAANGDGTCGSGCFTVPSNWNSSRNSIQVIGGGGGGATAVVLSGSGGGGGGGAYERTSNVALTPGASVSFNVGSGGSAGAAGGDTYFCNSSSNCTAITDSAVIVGAKGGSAGSVTTGGSGGSSGSGVGDTGSSGGAGGGGGTSSDSGGGGGGGAGGFNGVGASGGTISGSPSGGGGGGGSGGGSAGSANSGSSGGAGGNNANSYGGGVGSTDLTGPTPGVNGGGGGGSWSNPSGAGQTGADGGGGVEFYSQKGPGGGGGGGNGQGIGGAQGGNGGGGGNYGAGGGGGGVGSAAGTGGSGASGLIVIEYYPI